MLENLINSATISVVTTVITLLIGSMAATSLVTLIPIVVLTLIVQKDFVKGTAMGAVKG